MSIRTKNNKGQTTLEYIILIVIIIAALLTIQGYLKRGIQGRLRSSADDIGEQYESTATNHTRTTRVASVTNERTTQAGEFTGFIGQENKTVDESYNTANAEIVYMPAP
jgi:uncharacterized protein (UPF0333 family)